MDSVPDDEVAGLDLDVSIPDLITHFLQLPSFAPRATSQRTNPIMDFAKSIILTGSAYEEATLAVSVARNDAILEKARQRQDGEESKRQRATEREESNARKAL